MVMEFKSFAIKHECYSEFTQFARSAPVAAVWQPPRLS
jgi:hypothetical protein